jgi:hypothetical protein
MLDGEVPPGLEVTAGGGLREELLLEMVISMGTGSDHFFAGTSV